MTRHIAGAWNGMWTYVVSDGRTNFVCYGKGTCGLIGIKPTGSLSLHICCRIQKDIRGITLVPTRDVDEKPSQRRNDAAHVQMTVGNSGTCLKSQYIQWTR